MGKSKKLLSWLLVALVCVNLLAITALAATAAKGPLTLTLTTSREAYTADEQVDMLLTAANSGDKALKELHLEIKIPQGYHLCADSAATLELDSLLPGDSAILAPAMEADKPVTPEPSTPTEPETSEPTEPETSEPTEPETSEPTEPETSEPTEPETSEPAETKPTQPSVPGNPGTGDRSGKWLAVAAVALVVSLAALIVLYRKLGRRVMSIVLCLVLLGGLTAPAMAAELGEPETASVSTTVRVGGETVKLEAVVSFRIPLPEQADYQVALTENDALTYDADFGMYILDGKLETLEGTISAGETLENAKLELVYNDTVLKTDALTPGGSWSVEDFGALPGTNLLRFTLTDTYGRTAQRELVLLCLNEENLNGLVEDPQADTDGDQVPDYVEELMESDPEKADTDGDGILDGIEGGILGCDARKADTDDDGTPDGEEDPDADGLTNLRELELGTDPNRADSDGDGLSDKDEPETYGTDPLNADTDGDHLKDGWEIDHSTDPLVADAQVTMTETMSAGEVEMELTVDLPGEQAPTLSVGAPNFTGLSGNIPGKISEAVELNLEGELPAAGAELLFHLGGEYPAEASADFVPVVYWYNESIGRLEEVPTTYSGSVATAHLTHFSYYILLNKVEFDLVWDVEIRGPEENPDAPKSLDVVLVIDSSGSMAQNDPADLRLEAAKKFVEKLGENDRAAIIDFDSLAHVLSNFTGDKEALCAAIDKINRSGGTNLTNGISPAIDMFLAEDYDRDAHKYIIMLTDGNGSYNTSLTQKAADNGILIYTIGLGSGVKESLLRQIAEGTGAKYYFATTAEDLNDIYEDAAEETMGYSSDFNGDGISDYHTRLIAQGVLRDGAGKRVFAGAVSKEILDKMLEEKESFELWEVVYNSIQANDDFDGDGVPNGREIKVCDYVLGTPYVHMISDPTLINSDSDPFDDRAELYVYGYDPRVFNLMEYHVEQLTDDTLSIGAASAEKFVESFWYRLQLGLGNGLFGGEYDWSYAAQKTLLEAIEAYRAQIEKESQEAYIDAALKKQIGELISKINDTVTLINRAEVGNHHVMIMNYADELKRLVNMLDIEGMDKVFVYSSIDDVLKAMDPHLKAVAGEGYKYFETITVKVPKWLSDGVNGGVKYLSKAGDVLLYGTAAVGTLGDWVSTVKGHAALVANDEAYHTIYALMTELEKSEISFVSTAAAELKRSMADSFIQMVSQMQLLYKDYKYNFMEVGIELALSKAGFVGWTILATRTVSNLVSGIGKTSAQHIAMITAGEAGSVAGRMMMSRDYVLYADKTSGRYEYYDSSKDVVLLCAILRIVSEEKTRDAEEARKYIINIFNVKDNQKEFIDNRNARIELINRILEFYGDGLSR